MVRIGAEPLSGRHRWVDFHQNEWNASQIPPEWHSWLNHIRHEPPQEDPVVQQSTPPWKTVSHLRASRMPFFGLGYLLLWCIPRAWDKAERTLGIRREPHWDPWTIHHLLYRRTEDHTLGTKSRTERTSEQIDMKGKEMHEL